MLLVVSDFDGTLSELVDDPNDARPFETSIPLLASLAALDATHVAIVSGRGREDLLRRTGAPPSVIHIGSHGAEEGDFAPIDAPTSMLEELAGRLELLATKVSGLRVERKPVAVALHYRQAPAADAEAVIEAVQTIASGLSNVWILRGHAVIELCVAPRTGTMRCDKGDAVERLRRRVQATAVLFVGDDLTDEDALRTLTPGDLGVKVGPGTTAAAMRIMGVPDVIELLRSIHQTRRDWLADGHGTARI